MRNVDRTPTTVTLDAVSVTLRADVLRADLASVRRDYNDYRRQEGGRGETERARDSGLLVLDVFFEKYLLWTEAAYAEGVTEEALLATRSLVSAVRNKLPLSKREHVELLWSLDDGVQSKRSEFKAMTQKLAAKVSRV